MKRIKLIILWEFVLKNIKQLYHWAFNPSTGYFLKYKHYYYNGEPCYYYVICEGYRFFGIPCSQRIVFCYDMYEVNRIAKAKNITIK